MTMQQFLAKTVTMMNQTCRDAEFAGQSRGSSLSELL